MRVIFEKDRISGNPEIIKKGNTKADYTGGGIYIAWMPVEINGKDYYITYDSESLYNDEGYEEFCIVDTEDWIVAEDTIDGGYVFIEKHPQYRRLFKQLYRALVKELELYGEDKLLRRI